MNGFAQLVGADRLKRRFDWIHRELAANPFMDGWLRERCSLEIALNDILASDRVSLLTPLKVTTEAEYELVAFLAGVMKMYPLLSAAGQRRLQGRLIDGIQSEQGLLAVQHEVTTVSHLMTRGFDVECHDLEHGGGFDFLTRRDEVELEVECKMASGDIGRKIHKRKSLVLFKELQGAIAPAYASASMGLVVRVTLPDRLSGNHEDHRKIAGAVTTALLSGGEASSDACSVRTYDFPIAGSPFDIAPEAELSKPAVSEFIHRVTGQGNTNSMTVCSPGKRAVVLVLDSMKQDKVLEAVRAVMRDSAIKQFTKSRPGVLAVQLHDLSEAQFRELAGADSGDRQSATGVQVMTSDLLNSPSRAHIHSVVYRAHGELVDNGAVKTSSAMAYYIVNENHRVARDPKYAVFNDPNRPRISPILLTSG
ncbi:MAG TPA: hypothetical protein VHA82_23965 [Ramlibacter sp.]|uniref:hypothetical protein n=1 Tax=Ramlibacter sp. TaxID=1917967 RepID=UPI002C21FBAD|nr:hypothetical protein [Ramlibacter sp.]HVZ46884.1 hypothetical protein [Ramlibacter sp.]